MLSERGGVIEEDRPTQPWVEPFKDDHDRGHGFLSGTANKFCGDGEPALALSEDEPRPGLAADQDVPFLMSTFVPLVDLVRALVNKAAILDRVSWPASKPKAPLSLALGRRFQSFSAF
jgi:hypothetical protein